MLRTGLCSVTFRQLGPREVVEAARQAGLEAIEWGGDIHVPHGDTKRAAEVRRITEQAGLRVAAYGSYYRAGSSADKNPDFAAVLATAKALGAPVIRVWAGDRGSAELHEEDVRRVADDTRRIVAASVAEGIRVAFEYHNHTLTDTLESTLRLLRMVEQPDVFSYWQMARDRAAEEQRQAIRSLLPRLAHVHVFYSEDGRRLPLAQGEGVWTSFISELVRVGEERYLLLEFVVDDSVERMLEDAAVLKRLLRNPT